MTHSFKGPPGARSRSTRDPVASSFLVKLARTAPGRKASLMAEPERIRFHPTHQSGKNGAITPFFPDCRALQSRFLPNLPSMPIVLTIRDVSVYPARNPTTEPAGFTMLSNGGRAVPRTRPGCSLAIRTNSTNRRSAPIRPVRPPARTNSTDSTNELGRSRERTRPMRRYKRTRPAARTNSTGGEKRTRPAARTNSTGGANELDRRRERTRPTAQTNSTGGANELDRRRERTRPAARTNSAVARTNSTGGANELDLERGVRLYKRRRRVGKLAIVANSSGIDKIEPTRESRTPCVSRLHLRFLKRSQ